jgi:hypothetical protein
LKPLLNLTEFIKWGLTKMTTQLANSLTVDERIKTQAESAAETLAPSNSPQLVSSLTVDQLMEVIANVVDARLNIFFNSLNINGVKKSSEVESAELHLSHPVELKKENPWLKIAGMHKDNADLFEEVVAYMEASRQEILEEELA